jgi:hypothetical protein
MNYPELLEKIKYIDYLIRIRATGSPVELANKLKISLRSWHNLNQELKQLGAPIAYDKSARTYYYKENVKLRCEILWRKKEEIEI